MTNSEVTPNFLQVFDVDDGRAPCPVRTQTVTAPQGLFMMNSEEIEAASAKLAERLAKESGGDLKAAVDLGYRLALGRPPEPREIGRKAFSNAEPAHPGPGADEVRYAPLGNMTAWELRRND